MEDQVENQVDSQINSFGEFFASYSNNDNQYITITIPYCNTHLLPYNTIGLNSDLSHTLLKKDLFGELSNLDLLEFTYQEAHELSITESI